MVEGYLTKLFSSAMKEAADGQTARIEALEAENARLKEALKPLARRFSTSTGSEIVERGPYKLIYTHKSDPIADFNGQEILNARAALGEKP